MTRKKSRPSARPSTTSSRISSTGARSGEELARLIDALPPERREHVFTHTSWAPDRASSYERLEFLGDSVLELAVARVLYDRFPDASEGRLAKIRAHVVSRQSCAAVAKDLDLARYLLEQAQDVPEAELQRISRSRNVLAALLEAAIAAVYLEHGFEAVEQAVVEAFDERIEYARTGHIDNKTELQEALARSGNQVQYAVLDMEGPAHDRRFVCVAVIAGERVGIGRGSTKKAAEQEAARQALDAIAGAQEEGEVLEHISE
jgi:ribonuclease-3